MTAAGYDIKAIWKEKVREKPPLWRRGKWMRLEREPMDGRPQRGFLSRLLLKVDFRSYPAALHSWVSNYPGIEENTPGLAIPISLS